MARVVAKAVEHEGTTAVPFQGCGGKWENHPDLGGGGGTIAPTTSQRIVLLVLGGVACSERRSVHEISKRYGREVFIGEPRCYVLRCVFAGTWHPTAVELRDKTRTGMHRGPKSGTEANTHNCEFLWKLCAVLPAFPFSPRSDSYDARVCVSTAALLAFYLCFLAFAVASHFHATKKATEKGRKFVEHAPTASVFIHWC
ncbi:putative syntaxin binding protein [Trypanosoma cruzi]|nr:putative syntaxin binding protein [Trypanosoma cruzi]